MIESYKDLPWIVVKYKHWKLVAADCWSKLRQQLSSEHDQDKLDAENYFLALN